MVAELAAELVAAPLDLDVLAAVSAIALVAAVVAEFEPPHARHADVGQELELVADRGGGAGRGGRGGGGGGWLRWSLALVVVAFPSSATVAMLVADCGAGGGRRGRRAGRARWWSRWSPSSVHAEAHAVAMEVFARVFIV